METTSTHSPKFVRWALMLGIVVILNIFFTVIVSLVMPDPQYTDYCPVVAQATANQNAGTCDAQGGIWTDTTMGDGPKSAPSGYCDLTTKCQVPYQAAVDQHALYAFVIMIGLGLVSLVIGLMPLGSSIVSSGLSYGGVLSFVIGSGSYWSSANSLIKLGIAGVGLVALLYIGMKRFRD